MYNTILLWFVPVDLLLLVCCPLWCRRVDRVLLRGQIRLVSNDRVITKQAPQPKQIALKLSELFPPQFHYRLFIFLPLPFFPLPFSPALICCQNTFHSHWRIILHVGFWSMCSLSLSTLTFLIPAALMFLADQLLTRRIYFSFSSKLRNKSFRPAELCEQESLQDTC